MSMLRTIQAAAPSGPPVMETNTGFITLLGEHGANINAQDSSGQTALMNASDKCRDWEIKALLAVGADPSVVDKRGRSALQLITVANDPNCKKSRELLQSAINKRLARN